LRSGDVRDGTLGDADIGANAVSNYELTNNSVRSAEVQNGSLGAEDLQGGLLASDASVRFDNFAVARVPTPTVTSAVLPASARSAAGCRSGASTRPTACSSASRAWAVTHRTPRAPSRTAGAPRYTTGVWVICAAR
jgi:hypothetical protein